MFTALIFLIVLAVLIFVHELGHFVAARACGIRVDAFALGFGPKLFSWKRGETTYALNLIPFGGYVKIFGENPDDENTNGPDAARSFVHKKRWQQVIVLAAGVFFNFLFAWLLYTSVFITGVTATKEGFEAYSSHFRNPRIMVTAVTPDSPASKSGIAIGDTIPADSIAYVQEIINSSKGKKIAFTYSHKGENHTVDIIPRKGIVEEKFAIGIAMQDTIDLKLPFFSAISEGFHYTLVMIRETAVGLYQFVTGIFAGTAKFADVSGPVGIAGIVGDAAVLGFTYLVMITALISINLGVINLLPFPALDGGRILFVLIESVIRRRIPAKFSNTVNAVGFALLMLLMVAVTYKDIAKLVK